MKFLDFLQFALDNNYDIDWFGILGYTYLEINSDISLGRVDNVAWL
jgi:hypothetical protein